MYLYVLYLTAYNMILNLGKYLKKELTQEVLKPN